MSWLLLLLALICLAAAAYAQLRVRRLAVNPAQAWVARLVLALVGVGFGWTAVARMGQGLGAETQTLIFLAAFGLVHVPAAIVLRLKVWQRSGSNSH